MPFPIAGLDRQSSQVLTLTANASGVGLHDLLLLTKQPLSGASALGGAVPPRLPALRTLGLVVEASTAQGTRELQVRRRRRAGGYGAGQVWERGLVPCARSP